MFVFIWVVILFIHRKLKQKQRDEGRTETFNQTLRWMIRETTWRFNGSEQIHSGPEGSVEGSFLWWPRKVNYMHNRSYASKFIITHILRAISR